MAFPVGSRSSVGIWITLSATSATVSRHIQQPLCSERQSEPPISEKTDSNTVVTFGMGGCRKTGTSFSGLRSDPPNGKSRQLRAPATTFRLTPGSRLQNVSTTQVN